MKKKMKNTANAYIGNSLYTTLDTMEAKALERVARLDALIAKLREKYAE